MKQKNKSKIHFFIDQDLLEDDQANLIIRAFQEAKIKPLSELKDSHLLSQLFIFTIKKNIKKYSKYKNRIIVLDINEIIEPQNVEKINFNALEDILNLIHKVFLIDRKIFIQEKIKESEKAYIAIKESNVRLERSTIVFTNELLKELDLLLDLEMHILKEDQIQTWNTHFKNFIKKSSFFQSLQVYSMKDLMSEDLSLDESHYLLCLPYEVNFLFFKLKNPTSHENGFATELMVTTILRTIQILDQKLIKSDGEIDFWKKIFSKIPYPMSVISNLGDLLIYNESFAKIGILPKECLRFKDQDNIEIHGQYYKIRRIEYPINLIDVSYFVFYTSEDKVTVQTSSNFSEKGKKGNVNELGIISSSIAHELNNPLAGILAALSLLSLEEDWTQDECDDLEDMKNGAKRCKELVEIFLGFSKFSTTALQIPSIHDSVDQALNLLRFRMIESDLRLDIKYVSTLEHFSHQVNPSIMSMILYLILSELMTAFAHHRLVAQVNMSSMSGEVLEFTNQIILRFDQKFEYEEKLAQSKLIQHLLVFEKLEISFLVSEIRLIYKN